MNADPAVRQPAHAGTFYPAEPERLGALVDRLLGKAEPSPRAGRLVAALVPHAGLDYSGRIAALGWEAVGAADPESVLLLGTDHAGLAGGAAVWTGGAWTGPFGSVPVDEELVARVLELGPPFVADDAAHLDEHSLEVQMPFVARVCSGARIVPVLIGARSPDAAEVAGRMLGELVAELDARGRRAIIVASSDFAHYPSDVVARRVGRLMLRPLLQLDAPGLLAAEHEARRLPGVVCGMCGLEPALALVAAARALGGAGRLLGEATSAEVPLGDRGHTVGYAAVAISR